jgi:serine protease AprX
LSLEIIRIVRRAKRLALVQTLKRIRKPFAVWPLIAALIRPARALASLSKNGTIKIDQLKKPIPVYTLLLVLLIGVAVGAYASSALIHGTLSADSNAPDFSVALTPPSLTLNPGSIATLTIKLSSLYGFAGSVNLNATIPSKVSATTAVNPNSVSLLTGTGSSTLTVLVPASAPTGTFSMNLTGSSGTLSHFAQVFLVVTSPPPPDFTITANSSYLVLTQGSFAAASLTLSSVSGFSALVNLTATVSPIIGNGPVASLNPTKVALTSGGTANSLLSVSTSGSTPRRGYTIIVLATSGTFSHTFVISLTVQ